jgi:hypothetical protein
MSKKRSPVRMVFPGASTMIRFDDNDLAIGVSRDLLEKIGEATEAAVRASYRAGYTEGHAAVAGAAGMKEGVL